MAVFTSHPLIYLHQNTSTNLNQTNTHADIWINLYFTGGFMPLFKSLKIFAVTALSFIVSTGFFGFCAGPLHKPCNIQITSPAKYSFLPLGTKEVIVQGRIIKGSSEPVILKANGVVILFEKTNGAFSYRQLLDDKTPYTTVTYEVQDAKKIVNKERLTFAAGNSAISGEPGITDNAMRVKLTQGLVREFAKAAATYVNVWKNDMIYGTNNEQYGSKTSQSPFAKDKPVLPLQLINISKKYNLNVINIDNSLKDDHKGYLNIGKLTVTKAELRADRSVTLSIEIEPESWVDPRHPDKPKALFVQGTCGTHFAVMADKIEVKNVKMVLKTQGKDMVGYLDLSKLDLNIPSIQVEFHNFSEVAISALKENIVSYLKKALFGVFGVEPIVKIDKLFNIEDIDQDDIELEDVISGIWAMGDDPFVFSDMAIETYLGWGMHLKPNSKDLYPELTSFLSTPEKQLPELLPKNDENMIIALKDDVLNNWFMLETKAGILNLDLTDSFKGKYWPAGMKALLSADQPPVMVFTKSAPAPDLTIGRVYFRDIRLSFVIPSPDGKENYFALRVSADADVDMKLIVNPGTPQYLQFTIDPSTAKFQIVFLYDNLMNMGYFIPNLKGLIDKILAEQLKNAIDKKLRVDMPQNIDILNGVRMPIKIVGVETSDSALMLRARWFVFLEEEIGQ
jgi:hypothetical protein